MGTPGSGKRSRARTLLTLLLLLPLWPALCNLVVESVQRIALGLSPLLPAESLPVFLLNSGILALLLLLALAVTGRLWWAAGLLITMTTTVAVVNGEKLGLRFEPVYPADLSLAGDAASLMSMVGWGAVVRDVALVGLAAASTTLLARAIGEPMPRVRRRDNASVWSRFVVLRALAAALCLIALAPLAQFNSDNSRLRHLYVEAGARWDSDSQARNYLRDGFVGATLANVNVQAMKQPSDYSFRTMQHIAKRYETEAALRNLSRSSLALRKVNVVLVLSESFADPGWVRGLRLPTDPIPFTHEIMSETTSGRVLAAQIGGGTANMEFEALTGMSMGQFNPSFTYPYSMLVARRAHFPSAVDYFRSLGAGSVAVHPYRGTFYGRDRVYPALGFDRFIDESHMHFRNRLGHSPYISDESAFREVLAQIRSHERPLLVNLVTMQNHYPWGTSYSDPVTSGGLDHEAAAEAGDYLRGLSHSDQALRRFIEALKKSHEKTIVLFYGDHQPLLWPRSIRSATGYRGMHETPFFVWSNFHRGTRTHMPTTSPIYFFPIMLNMMGAPLTPFYSLLVDLQRQYSAMERGFAIGPTDREVPAGSQTEAGRRLLHDYRLVLYDTTEGRNYVGDEMFDLPLS